MLKKILGVFIIGLIAVSLFPLTYLTSTDDSTRHFRASEGVMDLSSWNPEKDGNIKLDGEWEFYWNKLLTPEHFRNDVEILPSPEHRTVPSSWNGEGKDRELPVYGAATYRLKLTQLPAGGSYSIKKTNIRFASAIYVNGVKLLEDGQTSMDAGNFQMGNSPQYGSFALDEDEVEIVVQVSNYNYVNAGITASFIFGEQETMSAYRQKRAAWDFVLLAMLGTMSLIYLFLFLATMFYRITDYSLLVFSVVCWLFALYTGLIGERPLLLFFPELPFELMYRLKDITSLVSFIALAILFYQLQKNMLSYKIALAVSLLLGSFAVLIAILPIEAYTPAYAYLIGMYELMMLGLLVRVAYIYIRSTEHQWETLLVFMALMCINLYSIDYILFAYSYTDSFWLGQYYLVAFNLLLILSVVIRFFEAYHKMNQMKDQLLRADKIKDDFLTNTSHELRTPLNAMVNIAETLHRGAAGPINEEQARNLAIVIRSGRKITYLVNELLDYSKMLHGDIVLSRGRIDLKDAVESVLSIHQFLLGSKPLFLVNSIPDSFPPLYADGNRLTQILHNLIGNAIKFTDSGTVAITADLVRDRAEIKVTDTGIGIDSTAQQRIFLAFEQGESSDTRRAGGAGLGLNITKKLVQLHGGDIRVESIPGSGSTFTFSLPLADKTALEKTKAPERAPRIYENIALTSPEYPMQVEGRLQQPILVVDDDPANLLIMTNLLRLEGCSFTAVNKGQLALEEIARNPSYHLVILDIMMPDMSGYEVLEKIRKRFSLFELPVLMLTAGNRTEDVKLSLELGANDIVGKPFEPDELMARVRNLTKLRASVKDAKASEIAFLRSQIKPHFLYNALNSIAELCVDEPQQAEELTLHLSQYLRRSFDFKQLHSYTTLANELELVQAYARIEQARFGARLRVEYDIDAGGSQPIPPLVLQPLVENAIRHGVMANRQGGLVKLSVRPTAHDTLHLMIEDTGCGMDEQRLMEVLQQEGEGRGVGLSYIRKQVMLLYGSNIEIESELGKGTKVSFEIPLHQ